MYLETCSIVKDDHGHTSKRFLFATGFVIPCVVIVGCYAKIFWVVHRYISALLSQIETIISSYSNAFIYLYSSESRMRKHATPTIKSPHTPGRDTREIKQRRSEWRITKMVLAIFLSFLVCYLPITIVKMVDVNVKYPGKETKEKRDRFNVYMYYNVYNRYM